MLLHVKGSYCYDDIRTVNGTEYPTYQQACFALGILDNDLEWTYCLREAAAWASGYELRRLFVTVLIYCQVSKPGDLWHDNFDILSEDIMVAQKKKLDASNFHLTEQQLQSFALYEVEKFMQHMERSLKEFSGMPMPNEELVHTLNNRCITEELDYDIKEQELLHAALYRNMNQCQLNAYNDILTSVDNKEGTLFFIQGHGGTGKTYLWNSIISRLRSTRKIVLAVASSGISALLLPNGRTGHSRFRIPINVSDSSTCDIKHKTNLAELLKNTSLIIWDEAPMTHKHCFEAIDRSLRDILKTVDKNNVHRPFGGITFVCGGDFRQTLPVIKKGLRQDVVSASLKSSYLWNFFRVYELHENMRLQNPNTSATDKDNIISFDKWMLEIGNGSNFECTKEETIRIPNNIHTIKGTRQLDALIHHVYPSLTCRLGDADYLAERAILTPKNEMVKVVNDSILEMIPTQGTTYLSVDTICKGDVQTHEDDLLYPTEFLNSLEFPNIPSHQLHLKIGCPVMLLRNLNQPEGLCNGTRIIVTLLGKWSIRGDILTGKHQGKTVTIPRIVMSPNDNKWPFKLRRRQLPVLPCYAMTINKSQGQSLKAVGIYLPKQVFTHGQLYVAVSRVTSPDGLVIVNADEEYDDQSIIKNVVYHEVLTTY